MNTIRRLAALVCALTALAWLTVECHAQDPYELRVELVALDDSIRRVEARMDSIAAEVRCLSAMGALPYGMIRGCFRSLVTVPASQLRPDPADRELLVAGALTTSILANALLGLNVDRGGYVDAWGTPDKAAHAAIAASLTFAGAELGARPWIAAALVCAAGYGFEHTQGTVSSRDAWANCGGAALAAGFTELARRWR